VIVCAVEVDRLLGVETIKTKAKLVLIIWHRIFRARL